MILLTANDEQVHKIDVLYLTVQYAFEDIVVSGYDFLDLLAVNET